MKEDNILCELCADTRSDVTDKSDNEILGNDSDVPSTISHKQLWPAVIVTTDGETSTEEEDSSEPESCDDKRSAGGVQLIKHQAVNLSVELQVWI